MKIMWYAVLVTMCIWYSNTLVVAIPTFFVAWPLAQVIQSGVDALGRR